ncbi:MAG: sugar ABC transporter permease [Clostridiales bacterium]|nr:sugar ABC transporter permease [Clostridiales bacterium]
MLLIPLAVIIIFRYVPMWGIQVAFRDYRPARGITGSKWVGLKYILKFIESYQFPSVIKNTLFINLYNLLTFPLPLMFAIMLNYLPLPRFRKAVQMVSYAPHFISTVVLCSLILEFTKARGGLMNSVLALFGVPAANWMAKPQYFYSIYVWSGVWQELGYNSIIFISALAGISPELHEAATMDGAGLLKRIWHVDIPGVLPTFCILLIMQSGKMMTIGYEKVLLLQNNINTEVSEVISTYAYTVGLASSNPQFSYSAAISLFTSLVNMIMLIIVNRLSRKLNSNSLW